MNEENSTQEERDANLSLTELVDQMGLCNEVEREIKELERQEEERIKKEEEEKLKNEILNEENNEKKILNNK